MFKKSSLLKRVMAVALAVLVAVGTLGVSSTSALAASKLTVKPASKTIAVGKTVDLKANKSVKWSVVKGSKYVKLTSKKSKSVKVKGLKKGTAVVKAKAGSQTKKVTIKVLPVLTVKASATTVEAGQKVTLKSNNSAKWSITAGKDVAKLSSAKSTSVVVTGVKAGSVTVKATDA